METQEHEQTEKSLRDARDEKRRHEQPEQQPLRGDESPDELISSPVLMDSQPETD